MDILKLDKAIASIAIAMAIAAMLAMSPGAVADELADELAGERIEAADDGCPGAPWAEGDWSGELQGAGLTVVFRISSDRDGCLEGTFDSPDQGGFDLPLSSVTAAAEQRIVIESDAFDFRYEGQYQGERIEGQFQQTGGVFVLDLERE